MHQPTYLDLLSVLPSGGRSKGQVMDDMRHISEGGVEVVVLGPGLDVEVPGYTIHQQETRQQATFY